MRRLLALAAFCLLPAFSAFADDDWGHDFDALIAQPGVKVSLSKINNDDAREIRLPNGVSFYQTRHNGKLDQVLDADNSGHGAVLCAMNIVLAVRTWISACPSEKATGEIADIDTQLDRIEDFVVANSLPPQAPVTKSALRSEIEQGKAKAAADIALKGKDKVAAYCSGGDAKFFDKIEADWSGDKLKSRIDDLLSAPRPPVANPCL